MNGVCEPPYGFGVRPIWRTETWPGVVPPGLAGVRKPAP